MDLNAVLLFTKVVQAGSFTAGARALGLPKSTASRKVAELERDLGAQLLKRTTRKLQLTDVGEEFYARTSRIVSDVQEAELAVSQLQATPRGTLRLTAPVEFGLSLAALLRRYMDENPHVKVDVVLTDRVVDLVEERFDLALRAGKMPDSSLIVRRLSPAKRVLCASPEYLDRAGTPRRPEDLSKHRCIVFEPGTEGATWSLDGPKGAVDVPVDARLRVNNYDMARQAALVGLGVAMLPTFQCADDVRTGKLVVVLSEWSSREVPMHAVYASSRHLTPKVRSFLAMLEMMGAPWQLG
jgi:DNA-binding transcriptional LysR family regulator